MCPFSALAPIGLGISMFKFRAEIEDWQNINKAVTIQLTFTNINQVSKGAFFRKIYPFFN